MIRHLCIFIAVIALASSGCELHVTLADGGHPSKPRADAGESASDAAIDDAGEPDSGTSEPSDAGVDPDAGVFDGGVDAALIVGPGPNGAWLTRNYCAYSSFYDQAVVDDLADRMKNLYDVGYLFMNVDRTGSDGHLIAPAPKMNEFLNNVSNWETRTGSKLRVIAWVSGATTGTASMDLSDPTIRAAVVQECQKLVSPSVAGSYVASTSRPFDGVQIDFEPSGFDDVRFNNLLALVDEIRAGLSSVGRSDAILSVAAHKLGTTNTYQWSPQFYYAMARHVDVLASMTYNSGSTTGAEYQAWEAQQLTGVLRAVSGQAWTDGLHPAPTNKVRVLFGLPAYPAGTYHDPAAESIAFGGDGLHQGMDELQSAQDPSLQYLEGASVYLHTKGTAADGYARWDTEWYWFGHDWLRKW